MNKKNLILSVLVVILAAVYVYFFTDWFKSKPLEIFHTSRSIPNARYGPRVQAGNAKTAVVEFGLTGGPSRLTEVKVVALDEWKTNPTALPMWHLISDSNSLPVERFPYGVAIAGMKPAVGNDWPKPLDPNVAYRIFVTAGSRRGEHDFITLPKSEREIQANQTQPRPGPRPATVRTNR